MSNHVSRNIFWLTLSRVVALFMLFLAYRVLLPYLGPYGAGQYFYVQSYVLLFSTVVDFGIQQLITKKISEEPERAKEYFQKFFAFELVVSLFLYFLLVSIAALRHGAPAVFFGISVAGLGMVTNAMCYPFMSVLAAKQDLRKVAWINFLNSCVNFTLMFATVFFHHYIVFLSSVTLIFGILDLILYRQFIKSHLPQPDVLKGLKLLDLNLMAEILKQGWPFALLVGFSAIYNRIDVVIISLLKGYEQTGLYTTAYRIFDLLNFFPAVVSFTLFPYFSGLMSKNAIGEIRTSLEKYLRLMIVLAIPIAAGGTVLSGGIIGLLTSHDPRYAYSAVILSVLIWAPAIQFIYIPVNSLVISQLTKKAMLVTGVNVIINTVGNLLLIPHYGIKAAAIMTVISESVQCVFYFYFVRKNITTFNFGKYLLQPIISAVVMAAVLWQFKNQSLFIAVPAGALIYVVMLILTGFLKKDDIILFRGLFSK